MRALGLDLGTKSLGVSIADRTNTLVSPLKTIKFEFEDYNAALNELDKIVKMYNVDTFVLGLPKNMDNSLGFASERSLNFKKMIDERYNTDTFLVDERLTTMEAEKILIDQDLRRDKRKKVIDSMSAVLILETYLGRIKNEK